MRSEPPSLPRDVIVDALSEHWGIEASSLVYAPLGFGSHHWVATGTDAARHFVTADDLVPSGTQDGATPDEHFEGLRDAFESAVALRGQGLEFVLAPRHSDAGAALVRVLDGWSMAVFPFLEGEPLGPGGWEDVDGQVEAARLLGRLHRATPPARLRRWRPEVPGQHVLRDALDDIGQAWDTGPFGESTRALLSRHRVGIERAWAEYEGLAASVMASSEPWVVSHGEPHSANFLRAEDRIYLIDWDTVRLAPRERDLELGEGLAFEAYREIASPPPMRAEARALFRLRWSLADVCVYVARFRAEHGSEEDDRDSWRHLNAELQRLAESAADPA